MLKSELPKAKSKKKIVWDFKVDLDQNKNEIILLKIEIDNEIIQIKHLEEKCHLLEHHN